LAAVDGGGRWLRSKGEVMVGGSSVNCGGGGGGGGGGDNTCRMTWEETSGNVSIHGISR
jgi:hypothetical protein